ncbi:hypothetical protein GGF42_002553 [Coemansia sp. RSA 2424]|nr:hypothetical protein GGF42_002553 [Coemansia sp. RSA 2424]
MFGFKKSKGTRNIRKKDDDQTDIATDESVGAADIVRRTAASEPRTPNPKTTGTTPTLSFGADNSAEAIETKRLHSGYELGRASMEGGSRQQDVDQRGYSREDMAELASESYRRKATPPVEATVRYPFAPEGIPDAHEIYLAKQLRRQRQAAGLADAEMDVDDGDGDSDASDSAIRRNGGQDYISLSDGLASSRIRSLQADVHMDDGAMAEGEDELDAVIVDKNERAEFNRTARRAKEESIEQAQEEDEPSDWEKEQLRNAGFAPALPRQAKNDGTQHHNMPTDDGGFEYDDAMLSFLLGQEKNQLALEQDQLQAAQAELNAAKDALDTISKNIAETQAQWRHFSSLAKSV